MKAGKCDVPVFLPIENYITGRGKKRLHDSPLAANINRDPIKGEWSG
jgi:hypothetical protein